MFNQTCSLCGAIFHNEGEMCETCRAMMVGVNPVSEPVFESNFALAANSGVEFQSPQFANSFQSNFEANVEFQSTQEANQSFSPPEDEIYQPPPINPSYNYSPPASFVPKPVKKESKPSVLNWFTELPTFAKIGLVVLIFSIGFAVILKGFMQMDLSVNPSDTPMVNQQGGPLESQKPWFSSWFRSRPTAEEIFEKYEKAIFAKEKNLVSQSFLVSGQAQFLKKLPTGSIDIMAVKNNQTETPKTTQQLVTEDISKRPQIPGVVSKPPIPRLTDFGITFEIVMKNPNKMLMKMMMTPKPGFDQSFKAFPMAGFDGTNGWSFTKTFANGSSTVKEQPYKNNNFFFNRTNDGISVSFLRSMYPKVELVGEAVVFDRRSYNVKTTDSAGNESNIFFDIETGLVTKLKQKEAEMYILEHQNFEGTLYPSRMVFQIDNDWLLMKMERIQANAPVDDSIFLRASYN